MLSRWLTNLLLLLLAGCLLVFTFALELSALTAIALGVGCAAVVGSMVGFALSDRGTGQRVLDALVALTGAWLVVSSRCLPEEAQKWLCFGSAALLAGLAVAGLIAREVALAAALRRASAAPILPVSPAPGPPVPPGPPESPEASHSAAGNGRVPDSVTVPAPGAVGASFRFPMADPVRPTPEPEGEK